MLETGANKLVKGLLSTLNLQMMHTKIENVLFQRSS